MNLYVYVNGNPVMMVDPVGLRLQVLGSLEDQVRILNVLNEMGCGLLGMDINGYISGTVSGDECSPCQGLREIIESPKIVKIIFSENASLFGGGSWNKRDTVSLAPEFRKKDQTYYQYIPWGQPVAPYHPESVIAHELLGHALDNIRGDSGQNEGNAQNQENWMNRKHGWPERW